MWHNPPKPLQGIALPKSPASPLTSLVSEQKAAWEQPQASSSGVEVPGTEGLLQGPCLALTEDAAPLNRTGKCFPLRISDLHFSPCPTKFC